ncbi:helix-turn-helix transcriptional regulator [Photobacterium sanctipauli]|uniref:helix-turn-helix transcriptional regulator n=2 Tax=Photobacterium sanctipauli TaxID=1342794 RepID=UPI001304938C|nr:helix-turn-helix transcriptional regulator [Photobacterium sanctipauli]
MYEKKVQLVIDELCSNLGRKWTVKEMASYVKCSEQHLRKIFLKHTNQSPKEYYLNTKLHYSYSLLKENKSVHRVAEQLGFYDSFHFSKAFKHKFGYSPSEVNANKDK